MPQVNIKITAEAILYALHRIGFEDIPIDIEALAVGHSVDDNTIVVGYLNSEAPRRLEGHHVFMSRYISRQEILYKCGLIEPAEDGKTKKS
jgi:hypothetical protein